MSFDIFMSATAHEFKDPEKFTIASCAANSENLFGAGLKFTLQNFFISLIIFLSKFFFEFIPVPTAVPPWARK